jgi:hypothetical protein
MEYLELNVTLAFEDDMVGWQNMSSTIRGIWGRSLRRAYCYQRRLSCLDCEMKNCTYMTIFEKKYGEHEQFHPYVIRAEEVRDRKLRVTFKFFGWLCKHYDKLLLSILRMEESMVIIKSKRYPFIIETVKGFDGSLFYRKGESKVRKPLIQKLTYTPELFNQANLDFITPFRQKYRGRLMSRFYPQPFLDNLFKRVLFFNDNFTYEKLSLPDNIETDSLKVVSENMRWLENYRRSFSQQDKMSLGGLVGKVGITGLSPEASGLLKLGEYFQAGKQTTFGNGCYRVIE